MTSADRIAYWRAVIETGRTRPMTQLEICEAFGYSRNHWDGLLPLLEGAVPFRGRWVLPLRIMPGDYLAKLGVPQNSMHHLAPSCTEAGNDGL